MTVPPTPYRDYIPAADAAFGDWIIPFNAAYLSSTLLVPDPTDVLTEVTAFGVALAAATSGATRGPATIAAKDAQRLVTEAIVRLGAQAMVNDYRNGGLTGAQLTAAGVRIPSTLQTPRFPPVDGPDLTLRGISPSNVGLSVTTPMSSQFRKPIGVTAAQIFAAPWVGGSPPADSALTYQQSATRKVANCDTSTVVGQQVRFRARWISVRGDVSNFGTATDVWCS